MSTASKKKGKNGTKKYGRYLKKAKGKSSWISAFVRNKISAEMYFKQTNQPLRGLI